MAGRTSCRRNCNDCNVHKGGHKAPDGTTGTQCKVFIPAYTGQHLRTRIRRYRKSATATMYGTEWIGDAWEVTIEDIGTKESWLVARHINYGTLLVIGTKESWFVARHISYGILLVIGTKESWLVGRHICYGILLVIGTKESWLVGRQLLSGVSTGIVRPAFLYEFLGCAACLAFNASARRAGLWVLEPAITNTP